MGGLHFAADGMSLSSFKFPWSDPEDLGLLFVYGLSYFGGYWFMIQTHTRGSRTLMQII